MKQVCKTRKIRKTFVNILNFCMGRCWIHSWRFQRRFKQVSKYEFAISLAVRTFELMRLQIRILTFSETYNERVIDNYSQNRRSPNRKYGHFTVIT